MKHTLLAASLVLAGSLTAGCGSGGTDASESATTKDFCTAYNSLFASFAGATEAPSKEDSVKAIKDWVAELEDTGTPEGIPDDARAGFELVVETVSDLDDDADQSDIDAITEGLSSGDEKDSEAFGTYAQETCPMEMPDMPEMPEAPGAG